MPSSPLQLLIQADGASRGNPGPASFGAVVFLANGEIIAERFEAIGIATNNQAEYRAVIAGLEAAREYAKAGSVEVALLIQMDSKLVVEQLSGRWKIKNQELAVLAMQAQALMRGLAVSLEWIPREKNSHADALANRALDEKTKPQDLNPIFELAQVQPKSIRAPRQQNEPTVIWAIRHGHTVMTESSLISGGGADPNLSKFGRAEANLIAAEILRLSVLFDIPVPSKVIHSPQLRAQETASFIANQLNIQLEADSRLREIEFGAWEGKSMDSLQGDAPEGIEAWRGSSSQRPPGGESVLDLELRVGNVIAEQTAEPGSVAMVAHMMPCRAIFRLATGAAVSAHWGLNFLPASVSIYRFYGPDFAEVFTVNSTAHLISAQRQE